MLATSTTTKPNKAQTALGTWAYRMLRWRGTIWPRVNPIHVEAINRRRASTNNNRLIRLPLHNDTEQQPGGRDKYGVKRDHIPHGRVKTADEGERAGAAYGGRTLRLGRHRPEEHQQREGRRDHHRHPKD